MAKHRDLQHVTGTDEFIRVVRGQKVILDEDLAVLYEVETKRLNEQCRRNRGRFPSDFMFQLSEKEWDALRSQIATANPGRGGRRTRPYAFTEYGAIMAATVLNSPRAVEMSVFVVRAFIRMREALSVSRSVSEKLAQIERRLSRHVDDIRSLVLAVRELMSPPEPRKKRRIGFAHRDDKR